MRSFQDESGRTWIATVRERPGHDYKGRYSFVFALEGEEGGEAIELADVRWNSLKTAAADARDHLGRGAAPAPALGPGKSFLARVPVGGASGVTARAGIHVHVVSGDNPPASLNTQPRRRSLIA